MKGNSMGNTTRTVVTGLLLGAHAAVAHAEYTETMDPNGPTKNLRADFGLVDDNAASNQSGVFQKAIDNLAGNGGGRLIVPRGTYRLAGIRLKSNIHLLIEKGTVIKPYWPEGTKTVVSYMDIPEEYHDDLELRWFSKFFEGPSIGAVRDSTEGHYHVSVENVTLEGFKYNNDKKILTPKDSRTGKWWQALRKWKSDRGIADE